MIGGTILSLVGIIWVSKKAKKEIAIAMFRKNSLEPNKIIIQKDSIKE